ncbi:hypothetical protein PISMIDRAFT_680464 [Pisolithus microcarpus 441]|uniref:Origin recognition complex subunit 5 n=1 Tax=Pisolithus microcarpus 441 TaxID=765257 RepID=A0A0C9ZRA2_9AGAM|nr:hypothetical protein PISMIDRAFT_680464 [Pisolithus microcarpus 441]
MVLEDSLQNMGQTRRAGAREKAKERPKLRHPPLKNPPWSSSLSVRSDYVRIYPSSSFPCRVWPSWSVTVFLSHAWHLALSYLTPTQGRHRLTSFSQARVRVNVILLSSMHWEDLRPPLGAAPDPYFLDVEPLTKPDIIQRLVSAFRNTSENVQSSGEQSMTYHPGLLSLYEHYAEMVYGTISLYASDPIELQYIAAARWPGFVKPVVCQQGGDDPDVDGGHELDIQLPNTDGRLRLFKYFSSSFTHALETLYPRLTNAADWASENDWGPTESPPETQSGSTRENARKSVARMANLPRFSKFILIAAFLASTNPAKSDMRIFGRGTSERKKRRRRNTPSTKGGTIKNSAVSQRLLGPSTFPLDRLLAILGALLEEHDVDSWPFDHRFVLPGEYTDMEIGRIHVYAAVSQLAFMRALHRMSPMEKMDGPPTFKCGISYEVALALAKDVGISSLNDLMWDPV